MTLLLQAIFGKREMKDNQRVASTLMIVAKAMFDEEAFFAADWQRRTIN